MKRRIAITGLAIILIVTATVSVYSAVVQESIVVARNQASIVINEEKTLTADNFNYNGSLYVPLRAVSEEIGLSVSWNGDTKTAKIDDLSRFSQPQNVVPETVDYSEYNKDVISYIKIYSGLSHECYYMSRFMLNLVKAATLYGYNNASVLPSGEIDILYEQIRALKSNFESTYGYMQQHNSENVRNAYPAILNTYNNLEMLVSIMDVAHSKNVPLPTDYFKGIDMMISDISSKASTSYENLNTYISAFK
jgi:hypothetical protein